MMSAPMVTTSQYNTSHRRGGTLHIVPALIAPEDTTGEFILTRKFLDGIKEYQNRWPGRVEVHMISEGHRDRHLDDVVVDINDEASPFRRLVSSDDAWLDSVQEDAAVFLVSLVDRNLSLVHKLAERGLPVVLITEQSVRTREEIIRSETRNPVLRWRRQWWSHRIERQYIDAVLVATGVQCNGAPTYESYRQMNSNALFYLDSRMTSEMLASISTIEQRCSVLTQDTPLRLAFSGRLVPIKGADDLPLVAGHLRDRGVQFKMDIIGGGSDEFLSLLRTRIDNLNLRDHVRLPGVMEYASQLVPHLRENIDLFVCCHRQGDPSCTYIETLGCGVPIVGYENEAWQGMHDRGAPGWVTRMSDPQALAEKIVELNNDRDRIKRAALDARQFSLQHTFQTTMDNRVKHLLECANSTVEART